MLFDPRQIKRTGKWKTLHYTQHLQHRVWT